MLLSLEVVHYDFPLIFRYLAREMTIELPNFMASCAQIRCIQYSSG